MFKVNDHIAYNSTGVYIIIDIRKERDINGNYTEYYVLKPAFNNNITIKTPVHNSKVLMRNILTKDEVLALIDAMPEKESIWIKNDRQRYQNFKAALRTGESEEWVKLIKTIYLEKQEKTEQGKKLTKPDEYIMEAAEKNLYEEFAVVLNISPNEVISYILKRISSLKIASRN
jgi:CarD family transcriptional regulator